MKTVKKASYEYNYYVSIIIGCLFASLGVSVIIVPPFIADLDEYVKESAFLYSATILNVIVIVMCLIMMCIQGCQLEKKTESKANFTSLSGSLSLLGIGSIVYFICSIIAAGIEFGSMETGEEIYEHHHRVQLIGTIIRNLSIIAVIVVQIFLLSWYKVSEWSTMEPTDYPKCIYFMASFIISYLIVSFAHSFSEPALEMWYEYSANTTEFIEYCDERREGEWIDYLKYFLTPLHHEFVVLGLSLWLIGSHDSHPEVNNSQSALPIQKGNTLNTHEGTANGQEQNVVEVTEENAPENVSGMEEYAPEGIEDHQSSVSNEHDTIAGQLVINALSETMEEDERGKEINDSNYNNNNNTNATGPTKSIDLCTKNSSVCFIILGFAVAVTYFTFVSMALFSDPPDNAEFYWYHYASIAMYSTMIIYTFIGLYNPKCDDDDLCNFPKFNYGFNSKEFEKLDLNVEEFILLIMCGFEITFFWIKIVAGLTCQASRIICLEYINEREYVPASLTFSVFGLIQVMTQAFFLLLCRRDKRFCKKSKEPLNNNNNNDTDNNKTKKHEDDETHEQKRGWLILTILTTIFVTNIARWMANSIMKGVNEHDHFNLEPVLELLLGCVNTKIFVLIFFRFLAFFRFHSAFMALELIIKYCNCMNYNICCASGKQTEAQQIGDTGGTLV